MLAFDTLQVAKDLEAAFTPEQAEVLVKALSSSLTQDLATKQDLAEAEARLRGDIKDVRAEIKDLKAEMIKWIAGALLVNFFGVGGLVVTLIKSIAH